MQSTADMWVLLCEELEAQRHADLELGHQSLAARTFEDAAKQVFPNNVPRLRDALEIAGDIHQSVRAESEASRCFAEALAMTAAGDAPLSRARLATKLALLFERHGSVQARAVEYYRTAIAAYEELHDRSQLPTLFNNLAGIYKQQGNAVEAENAYRQALAEAEKLHGANHPEVALIANNMGVALTDMGELAKAEDLHLTALAIRERNFGGTHPEVAQSMANLGVVYHAREEFEKAKRYYESALEILRHFRSDEDEEVQRIQGNYERLPGVRIQNLKRTRRL